MWLELMAIIDRFIIAVWEGMHLNDDKQ
jgi:hypothetical protein